MTQGHLPGVTDHLDGEPEQPEHPMTAQPLIQTTMPPQAVVVQALLQGYLSGLSLNLAPVVLESIGSGATPTCWAEVEGA